MSVVVKGKVTVKVHGVLKQKQLSGNWAVLYDGGGKNDQPPCITLFEANDLATPLHTIILEQLKFPDKSYQHQEPFLVVSIKKDKHQFHFEDAASKEEWVHSFCHVSTDLWKQWASGKESSEAESDSFGDMSDNLLYDSFSAAPTFKVSVNPSPASERNNVKGHYLLSPTKDSLKLLEIDTSKCLFEWSYKQIRKYGKTSTLFKMEVGRSCPTGPGEFIFFTPDGLALSEVIAMQTRLTFNQSYKPPQEKAASSAPAEKTDYAECQSSDPVTSDISAQQPPPAATPQRRETKKSASTESRRSQVNSTPSVDSKREIPKPAPRTSINKAKQERSSMNGTREAPSSSSSSDTKIYATSSGLTAPLDSPLKHELQNKVQSQLSHTSQASQIEDDPASDNARNSISSHGSSESLKDKRKSDRERKKLEKEQKAAEAKRKKQLEKEQKEREKELKEQRERETKEEKERQKKLKKESKSREKLKSKKSIETPVSVPEPCADGNIYDEPGELLKDQQPTALGPVDSGYCEAGDVIPALQQPSKSSSAEAAAAAVSDVYATPFKPKDSWKTHARPESDHVHDENYDAIKQACQTQPNSQRPAYSPPSHTLPGAEDVDDTYNHLGAFKPLTPAPENIYGMASAKDTVEPDRPAAAIPSVVENEYEEASAVCTSLSSKKEAAQVREDHGKTDAPQRSSINIRVALDDDYAGVSDS